ncbi:hypothetical protein [Aquibacillus sediminis]|uniref:hypothetical protein n=1 Tax=Aquibacillus sediminis TaxID=2574734 RepID=UPI00110902F3|nr:hypothetical protein [Aquibacillus sediminis]
MKLTVNDFRQHLKEQIEFLQLSAESYDHGYTAEGKRLAVIIRVLVHHTKHSHSLLSSLNRSSIDFYDSAYKFNSKNLLPHMGLMAIQQKSGQGAYSKYIPLIESPNDTPRLKKRSFKSWWSKQIVLEDSNKNSFTRKDLVLGLSNKDGGAHVDPKLSDKYASLFRHNSLGWHFNDGVNKSLIAGVELAAVRQIVHEVLVTLNDEFPNLF